MARRGLPGLSILAVSSSTPILCVQVISITLTN